MNTPLVIFTVLVLFGLFCQFLALILNLVHNDRKGTYNSLIFIGIALIMQSLLYSAGLWSLW